MDSTAASVVVGRGCPCPAAKSRERPSAWKAVRPGAVPAAAAAAELVAAADGQRADWLKMTFQGL